MKKLIFALLPLCLLSQIVNAQITLTSANTPINGTRFLTKDVDTTAAKRLNLGAAGASQTWNFSTVALDPAPASLKSFASTVGAPSANRFPTATLIERQGLTNAKGINYHRINTSEWVILGDVDSAGQATVNPDPQTVFKYPFTMNSTFKDTFFLDDPDFGAFSVTTTTTGDAWGSIQTSLGTFSSLRLRRVSAATFSLFGIPVNFDVTQTEWWANQHAAPVFTHGRTIITSALISGSDTTYDGSVLTSQTLVSTQEVAVNHIENAFPSPASNLITMDIDVPVAAKVAAILVSTNGSILKTRNIGDVQSGRQQINFDVSDMPTGVYQVILMSDKGKLGNHKIVVAH